jgi:glycosyltransferase involved in cell wall biosynthesis
VTLCGRIAEQRELAALYLAASLLLMPSHYDADPLVLKEAAAHGVPSLAIADTIMACDIVHGENGYLAPYDALSYAEAIGVILADERRGRIGEAARRTIYRHWDDVAKDILQNYAGLIGGAASA